MFSLCVLCILYGEVCHGLAIVSVLLSSCYYKTPALDSEELSKKTKDSLTYLYERHYTWNTNLEVVDDSISLECLPIKDTFIQLNRGIG